MIRLSLPLLLLGSGGCGPDPDPVRTFVGGGTSGTTRPMPTHHLTWQVDGEAAVEMDILDESVHVRTASGAGCSPSVLATVYTVHPSGESAQVSLYFPEVPAPDVEAPLPAAERRDPNDPFAPYFTPVAIDSRKFLGGTVTVDAFDATGWAFRFDGLSDCSADPCSPIGGATLIVEPLPLEMPEMSSPCIAASAFPWPDAWDGCAVTTGSFEAGTCPSPMPW